MPKPIQQVPGTMTQLSPLEEHLFRTWARANGVQNHDDPNNFFDHRGMFRRMNGAMLPPGELSRMADAHNSMMEGQDTGELPMDPMAAMVEMQRVKADSAAKQRSDMIKIQLKKMELEHKSMEAEKDRQHKTSLAHMQHQQKAEQAQMQAVQRERMAQAQSEQRMQQVQMAEQNKMRMAEASNQNKTHSNLIQQIFKNAQGQPDGGSTPSDPTI